ncbi:MAG TPA: bifunctional precorrin-2 dehydrogenase/sirohydrochlorin ferrochelatase [Methylomirabilota bacterium]|jgi:precorrin-2 dehydrogenase/sirohydrochlorin ferrochelatase|nr:bifunctional precorrin-2 dehydrogenase/sirohydrochlorin ferrochelatase [Methylomirabilota bacterium]
MRYYPICVDMAGRACLVVGGGMVAERKASGLLESGARVTVVSPALTARLEAWAHEGQIRVIRRGYEPGDLADQSLVFVATDDGEVNATVAADARAAGVLTNAADDPAHCDFIIPAVLTRGALTVAVSTGGASPALSRAVRDELETHFDREDYASLLEVAADARARLRERSAPQPWERWRQALDGEVRRLVSAGRVDEARARLMERLGD